MNYNERIKYNNEIIEYLFSKKTIFDLNLN